MPADLEILQADTHIEGIRESERMMANGWARDGAVQDQIDDSVAEAVLAARARMPTGEGAQDCAICGDPIPARRRLALPGAKTCIACQAERDGRPVFAGINRRGSKDSQLR